jgi:type I restriction enzyme S subunit
VNGWKKISLRNAGVSVIDCDHRTPPAASAGYPYIAIPQLKQGRIDLTDVRRIAREHFVAWTRKANPKANDVILSRRCNPGETAVVPAGLECALGQNLVLLRADEQKMFPPFLRWLVRGNDWWEQIGKFLNVGAVFDSLKCSDIPNSHLPIPPLAEQRAIAGVLGALDDKIELNRQMNQTLEALAQTLFKHWFVPACAAERSGAADRDACLRREGSGRQATKLPKGWREESLDHVATFLNGLALQKFPPDGDDSLPVIKIAQLRAGNTDGADQASFRVPTEYVIEDGDVLFSWSGSLEVELWCGGRGALNQHLFKVSSDQFPKWFYFLWTRHHLSEFQAIAADKTTTMGHIQRKHLTQAKVFVPTPPELKEMSETMSPLIEKLITNNLESRTLAALRDALLPKLLSGELRLPVRGTQAGVPFSS